VVSVLLATGMNLEAVWRVSLGLGCVPGLCILYWRQKLEETHVPVKKRPADPKKIAQHAWNLFGTASTWFLFDIAFYGNGFFKETIIQLVGLGGTGSLYDQMVQTTQGSLIIAALALPGYWVSLPLIEWIGRKPLQIIGFAGEAILFFILGALFTEIQQIPGLFVVLYGLTFFYSNMGPNTTTYVLSAESYPKEIRSTCHGISSACGKAGALIGTAAFPYMVTSVGVGAVFYLCGAILVLGVILTYFFIDETKAKPLAEEVEMKKQDHHYGKENGDDDDSEEKGNSEVSSKDDKENGKDDEKKMTEIPLSQAEKDSDNKSNKDSDQSSGSKDSEDGSKDSEGGSKDSEGGSKDSEGGSKDKENKSNNKENSEDDQSTSGEDETDDKENSEDDTEEKEDSKDDVIAL